MSRLVRRHVQFLFSILLLMTTVSTGQASVIFSDPVGDTFGAPLVSHDITSAETTVTATDITFLLSFLGDIAPASDSSSLNNLVGYIDIDADQDSSTGSISNQSLFSPNGPSDLGIEYYVDLFSEAFNPGFVDVVDAGTGFAVGNVPITFASRAFSLTIPLALLGGDNGNTNYGAIIGDFLDSSDEITNFGLAPAYSRRESAQVVPEPSSLVVWSLIVAGVIGTCRRARRVTRNPKRLPIDC
ncbi:MAG: hypothetical protein ACYC0X_31545 [Pirellulaceae bacterium]